MTQRERFLRYMRGQTVDRVPLMEMGLWPETLDRWHHEGLPPWVTDIRHLEDYLVPPDVSYETYLYYVERRRELLGGPVGRST